MKLKHLFGTLAIFFLSLSSAYADSDGTVAFGKDYIVFTEFGGAEGQVLNVVPFVNSGPLKVVASADLPVSYSTIVIKDRFIFVRWWQKLLIFQLDDLWKINLVHTFELPRPAEKIISVDNDNLYLYNEAGNQKINITKPFAQWHLENSGASEETKQLDWIINNRNDWVPKSSNCVENSGKLFCLVYGDSSYFEVSGNNISSGRLIYYDKYLVRREERGNIESILKLNTIRVTID